MSPILGSGTVGQSGTSTATTGGSTSTAGLSPWHVTVRSEDARHALTGLSGPDPAEITDGRGGWEEVTRNRRTPVTQWVGSGLAKTTVTVWLSGWSDQSSIEPALQVLDVLAPLAPTGETPRVLVVGAPGVPATMRWVIQSVQVTERLRLPTGETARAQVILELLEYRAGDVVVARQSATKRSVVRNGTPAATKPKTYTVRKGDTLAGIAARLLGKSARWTEIAKLNSLRNPNSLKVGQKLKLPA